MAAPVLELPERDVLDELDVLRNLEHLVACDRLCATAQFLAEYGTCTVDPATEGLPGRERAVRLGGVGTPKVAEFAPGLAAGRLEISVWAAGRLCADVLDLVHRLPRIWAGVCDYRLKAPLARLVAFKTRGLDPTQAALVEARVLGSCDGRLPYGRFLRLVEAAVAEVDAEAVAAREQAALTDQYARATRTTVNGMRGFYVRAPFPVITRLEATVAHVADALAAQGHSGTVDELRVLAVLVLANPVEAVRLLGAYHRANTGTDGAQEEVSTDAPSLALGHCSTTEPHLIDIEKLLPAVVVYLHLTDQLAGVARVEGIETEGEPVTADWVRTWLGPRARFTIKPVLLPDKLSPVDGYEVPARHREAVHLMTPADCFPWAGNTTRAVQIDHTTPYKPNGPPGQSRIGNYGPLVARHHRMKTHGGWQCAQPFPGIYLWQDPTGATYLVDHTGTRRLHTAA